MYIMMLSKSILPLLLAASTSHAFGPYARQLKNITVAATGTASSSVTLSTGISSSSSGASTVTASSLSGSISTSNLSSISTGDPSSTGAGSASLEDSSTPSSTVSFSVGGSSNTLPPSSTGAAIVPITMKATDGSQQSTVVTWSAIETKSTSTTDNNGQPTAISPPFYVCNDPLCIRTSCVLAILCVSGGSKVGFGGFPPPNPPPGPPPGPINGRPSGSASQGLSTTDSASVRSTISSSTSSTSSTTCGSISTVVDPGPSSVGDPDDGSRRRVRRGTLVPREAPVVSTIGLCPLATNVKIPSFSSYTGAMNLGTQPNANKGANGQIYNAIEKWYGANLAVDGTPFSGVKQDRDFSKMTGPGSIDHVWEKSNLGDFLAYLLKGDFDCDDLNVLFSSSCSKTNLLQQIFDQLPSMDPKNIQTGFAAMNQYLNGMKGWMFSQGYSKPRFNTIYGTNEKIVQGLQRQAIIFNLFNTDSGIQSMHDHTNNRVYQAFLGLDDYISTNKIQRAKSRGDYTLQFGPAFKTWYGQLLSNTGSAAYEWASNQLLKLEKDPSISDCLKKAINAFGFSPLYGKDKFQIDQSHLSWVASPQVLIKMHLFRRDGVCAATTNLSATPVPSTTLSIATSQTAVSSSTPSSVATSSLPSSPSSSAAFSSIAAISSVMSPATSSTTSPPSASVSNASFTCVGNQVQGSCVSGSLPSAAPYSGEQGPSCDKASGPGSPDSRINITQAEKGAVKYCAALAKRGVILSANGTPPKPFIVPDAAENHQDLGLSIVFDISACPQDKSNSTLDFKKLGIGECQYYLFGAVSEVCAQDSTWEDYNPEYTLEGGSLGINCALWKMFAQPK